MGCFFGQFQFQGFYLFKISRMSSLNSKRHQKIKHIEKRLMKSPEIIPKQLSFKAPSTSNSNPQPQQRPNPTHFDTQSQELKRKPQQPLSWQTTSKYIKTIKGKLNFQILKKNRNQPEKVSRQQENQQFYGKSEKQKLLFKIQEENQQLKKKLTNQELVFKNFKDRIRDLLCSTLLENQQLKRMESRISIGNNKVRLGEMISYGNKQVWTDGWEIHNIKQKIQKVNKQKDELQKKKKNLKGKKQDQQIKNTLYLEQKKLKRQEEYLIQEVRRLDNQKHLMIREYKKIYQEDHSKYGKYKQDSARWPILDNRYQLLSLLGKGGFSQVYKAFDLQQLKIVACKIHQVNKNWQESGKQNYIKHVRRESKVHGKLDHPHIVKSYANILISETAICTVMEYCQGPDLSSYLYKYHTLSQNEGRILIKQILFALKYLHDRPQKIIHFDLKPQNILFQKGLIKITDFGLCKLMSDDKTKMQLTSQGQLRLISVGTYWYLPPECFVMDQPTKISTKLDIWSVGVIYFQILFGKKPFGDKMNQLKILQESVILKSSSVEFPIKTNISPECRDFIVRCLTYNESERMDVHQALSHAHMSKKK